jgi:hypothetical protein
LAVELDVWVGIRDQVVERMATMSARHAEYAWVHRRDRPVGPHALAFLYADAVSGSLGVWWKVVAGTRMVHDDTDARHLPRLLYRFARLGRDRYVGSDGGFNPGVQLCNRHDASSGLAEYIGIAVSTLDTPGRDWAQTQATAVGAGEVAGRCFVVLGDGTGMLIDRAGEVDGSAVVVAATRPLNSAPGRRVVPAPQLWAAPGLAQVWEPMWQIHTLAWEQPERPRI